MKDRFRPPLINKGIFATTEFFFAILKKTQTIGDR